MNKINSTDSLFSWQFQAQNPATPVMEGIITLHNYVLMYLILVFVVVVWFLLRSVYLYFEEKKPIKPVLFFDKQPVGNTEDIWTIAPLFIVIALYIPSMAFLYSMDDVIEPLLNGGTMHKKLVSGHSQNPSNQFLVYDAEMLGLTKKPGCVTGTLSGIDVFTKSAKCKCLFIKSGLKPSLSLETPGRMSALSGKLSNMWSKVYLYISGLYVTAKSSGGRDPDAFAKVNMLFKKLLNERKSIDISLEQNRSVYNTNLFLKNSALTAKIAVNKSYLKVQPYLLEKNNLSSIWEAAKKHSSIFGHKKPLNLTFAASNVFLKWYEKFPYTGVKPVHLGGADDQGFDMFVSHQDWVNAAETRLFREYVDDLAYVLSAKSSIKYSAENLINKNIQEFSREKQIFVLKQLGSDIKKLYIPKLQGKPKEVSINLCRRLGDENFIDFFFKAKHPSFRLLITMSLDTSKTSEQITTELFEKGMDQKMINAFTLIERTGDLLSNYHELKFSNTLEVAVLILSDNIVLPSSTAKLLVEAGVNEVILIKCPKIESIGELIQYKNEGEV